MSIVLSVALLGLSVALLGCAPKAGPADHAEAGDAANGGTGEPATELKGANPQDAPEISRSVGVEGGAVVFWPRIVPRSDDPGIKALAAAVQKQLAAAVEQAGVTPVDVRPEPERVCPKAGCAGMTVGAIVVNANGGGCSVLGLVAPAGQGDNHIVPWHGLVKLKAETVPFREPPESQVTVRDNVPCKGLAAKLGESQEDLVAKIKALSAAQ
jgi:hypothetical protein